MLDSLIERWHMATLDLVQAVNRCQPDQLPQLVNAVTEQVAARVAIYLVDYEQRMLRPLPTPDEVAEAQPVEGGAAGRAYRDGTVEDQIVSATDHDQLHLWVPLLDGTERLGVLRVQVPDEFAGMPTVPHEPFVQFANLVGHLVAVKLPYGDRLQLARRSQPMSVASELLRKLLPPSTFTSDRLVISANLQPPYAVSGDAFDYAVDGDTAYLAVFDGEGQGLNAGLTTAVALAATRAARWAGDGMYVMAQTADTHLNAHFDDGRFVTAILAQLDLDTGLLHLLNAGHPAPVLLRGSGRGDSAMVLDGGNRTPLGVTGTAVERGEYHLEPGDRLLLYTDGITGARDQHDRPFGLERLCDLASRHSDGTMSPPETARRITQDVLDYHRGPTEDDGTVCLVEWSTSAADRTLTEE